MILLFTIVLLCFSSVEGQVDGICACTPSIYEWTLDFSADCLVEDLESEGISQKNCNVEAFEPDVTDLAPVRAVTIDILEFDQNMATMQQTTLFGDFFNGDSFTHISSTISPSNVTRETVPRAIQISILGVNIDDQPLLMIWIIEFTNECGVYPVFFEGDQLAWTIFANLTAPDDSLCPATLPTLVPSLPPRPTLPPAMTSAPITPNPTKTPTRAPLSVAPVSPGPTRSPIYCPPPSKGKGKGFVYPSNDYYAYEYDRAYRYHAQFKSGKSRRELKESKSSKASKSSKSESRSTGKGKGKGSNLFKHPTWAPTSARCLEPEPTPAPVPHQAPSRSMPSGFTSNAAVQSWRNGGPTVSTPRRPTFTGPKVFSPQYLNRLPTQPAQSPTGSQKQQQQGTPTQTTGRDFTTPTPRPTNKPTPSPINWNSFPTATDYVDGYGGYSNYDDDSPDSSGMGSIQVVLIILLCIGVVIFGVGAVVYCAYKKRNKNKGQRRHDRLQEQEYLQRQQQEEFHQQWEEPQEQQWQEPPQGPPHPPQGTFAHIAPEIRVPSSNGRPETPQSVQSRVTDPWSGTSDYSEEGNYESLFHSHSEMTAEFFDDEPLLDEGGSEMSQDRS